MRLLLISMTLFASIFTTPVLAQPECCQCGPSACGPALAEGDCAGCELIRFSVCDGDTGQCVPQLDASLPTESKAAPAVGGGSIALLTAALTALGLSLVAHRRRQG